MSVRNRYGGNYTKIAPFPPPPRHTPEAKTSSKRHGEAAPSSAERKQRSKVSTLYTMEDEPENVPVFKHRKNKDVEYKYRVRRVEELKRQETDVTLLSNRSSPREKRRNDADVKSADGVERRREVKQRVSSEKKSKQRNINSNFNFHATGQSAQQHQRQQQDDSDSDELIERASRPKSARPESRWERRHDDSPADMDRREQQSSRQSRPKSARPESRYQRRIPQSEETEDEFERPKTSHGRRAPGERVNYVVASSPESEPLDMPEYPYGDLKYAYESDESFEELTQLASKKRANANNRKNKGHKSSRTSDKKYSSSPFAADGFVSGRGEQIQLWRGNTLVDLNSGIDDIDLDVDPVLYFMQDDSLLPDRVTRKPSLSKDAIEYIGNVKSSHHGNNLISRYGNPPNKYSHKTGIDDRHHGNRFASLHNTVPECDNIQFNQDSNYWNKSNRGKRLPASRDIQVRAVSRDRHGRAKPTPHAYSAVNLHRAAGNAPVPRATYDASTGKEYSRGDNLPLRKPRKLQPLSMSYYND